MDSWEIDAVMPWVPAASSRAIVIGESVASSGSVTTAASPGSATRRHGLGRRRISSALAWAAATE